MFRAALTVGCMAIAALTAPPALAGSYVVRSCSPETSPGVWTQVNTAPAGYASGNLCGGLEIGPLDGSSQGALYAEDILDSATTVPDGARAGWTFTAPTGTRITSISYYRTLASHNDRDAAAGLFQADASVLEQCRIALPFGSPSVCSKPNNQVPVVFTNLNTTSLFFGVICDIVVDPVVTGCLGGGTIHDVQAYMYSAAVTISESSVPIVSNVGGALWGGGLVSGMVPVTFSAGDGSGIREQVVQSSVGQAVVATSQDCDYRVQPPCPQSPNAVLSVDTTRVADGTQTFRLVVTDAAGNSTVVTSPPVTVDNLGPPPPVGLTATSQRGSRAVELRWSNPVAPPAPVKGAVAQLCAASCLPAVSVDAVGAARLDAPGPGRYTARVWLLDTAGRGGPHNAATAVVTVTASPPAPPPPAAPPSGTRTKISATVRGRRLRVGGPIGVGGRVAVSWRSKIGGRTVGHGSRTVAIRNHRLRVTFVIPRRSRVAAATIRVAVRRGRRIVGHARARRA